MFSVPLPRVYKIKHLAMQTAFTSICKTTETEHGTVTGCHSCNESPCEMYSLLNIPRSTISGITKWKCLGTTAAQPQGGRPHKVTAWGLLRCLVFKSCQPLLTRWLQSSKSSGINISTKTGCWRFTAWVSIAEQLLVECVHGLVFLFHSV